MFLQVMADEPHLLDTDQRKNFTMIEIPDYIRLVFKKDGSYPEDDPHIIALIGKYAGLEGQGIAIAPVNQSMVVAIPANAYVLNKEGKTLFMRTSLDKHGVQYQPRVEAEQVPTRTAIHVTLDPDDPYPEKTVEWIAKQVGNHISVSKAASACPAEKNSLFRPLSVYVEKDWTLRKISMMFGVDVADLVRLNRLNDPDHIETGQLIWLETPEFIFTGEHDTIYHLSNYYGLGADAVMKLNTAGLPNATMDTLLPEGKQIYLRNVTEEVTQTTKPARIIVKKGDTLSDIAVKYGVSLAELTHYNRLRNINAIQAGQDIWLERPHWVFSQKDDSYVYLCEYFRLDPEAICRMNKVGYGESALPLVVGTRVLLAEPEVKK